MPSSYSSYGSSSYASYGSSSYGSSATYGYGSSYDPCAGGGHRRLAGGGGGGGDDHGALTLFDFAFASRSDYVVYSFIVIIAFSVGLELFLENLEHHCSEVYAKVLQKLYKELMLLGLISFALFIIQFSFADLDIELIHSFEFAHFVMFFVGCFLILQTTWSCVCNHEIKKRVWIGCSRDYERELKPGYEKCRHRLYFPFSTTFHYIQMQLFRFLFLDVFDLPEEFSYPHCESSCMRDRMHPALAAHNNSSLACLIARLAFADFNKSLDAHTVELVDVQYSSYVAVLVFVVVSEFLVRYCGPSEYAVDGRVVVRAAPCPPVHDTQAPYLTRTHLLLRSRSLARSLARLFGVMRLSYLKCPP